MDILLYFSGIKSLFIIAPQNVPQNGAILLQEYCDAPNLLKVLLVSTNTYSKMSDGNIVPLTLDYDISVFNNLKLLLINPCQDIRTILSIDGLFDSEAGLSFCDKLVTPQKFNVLLNRGNTYPKSIKNILILSSPLHKFFLLRSDEKLLFPGLESVFVSTTLIRMCFDINTLVPYLLYSIDCIKDGIINPNLSEQENVQLVSLIKKLKEKWMICYLHHCKITNYVM